MTAITKYTDTATVRALVGLSIKDVKDQMFVDMNLDDKLLSDLTDWLPTHDTVYTDGTEGSPTDAQLNDLRNLKLYSGYYCASQIDNFQLTVLAAIGDGKNTMKRFEGTDFDLIASRMRAEAATYKLKLEKSVNATAVVDPILIGLAVPTYDPVTNT